MGFFSKSYEKQISKSLEKAIACIHIAERERNIDHGRIALHSLKKSFEIYNNNNLSRHWKVLILWYLSYLYGRMNLHLHKEIYNTYLVIELFNILLSI